MDRSKSHTDLLTAGRKKKRAEPLSPEEESDLELANQILLELFQKCVQGNIPLLVDAEHIAVQPAIDYFTYSSAIMHNNGENPIVFGTIQTYLKDAKERLLLTTEAADKMGVPMGFKLVRGAYMSTERFQVSKYMPFGPVEMVMPYLLRRAEENKGLLAASGFDRQLIRKELGRRLKAVF
ncbi:Proline dehydrogenase domain [Sesbania bispinosa]|nr:Proline dehydrogenase domain [Sesbania bispinosa]